MKEYPILFYAPMVRAILGGRKTQTRRVVKWRGLQPCPYGGPGDHLWVKETFYAFGRWETRYSAKKGRDEWHFVDMTIDSGNRYHYAATESMPGAGDVADRSSALPTWWRRPSIFMPRAASRITPEIVSVRVKRLQDISEAEARTEGAPLVDEVSGREVLFGEVSRIGSYRLGFRCLWESINGDGSWDANPWIWVIEFRRLK